MKRRALIALLLAVPAVSAQQRLLTIRETTGDTVRPASTVITATSGGWDLSSKYGTYDVVYILDRNYHTVSWTVRSAADGVDIKAVKNGETVRITGTMKGKPVDRAVDYPKHPWMQDFNLPVGAWVITNPPAPMKFSTINLMNYGWITMSAENKGRETVTVDGKTVDTYHVRLSLTGVLSWMWHGDYWFRSTDGRFIRYEGNMMPGSPKTVYELVGEE